MTRKVKVGIGVGIGVAVLVAALLTVLNKRWWIKRIQAKWVTTRWLWQSDHSRWELQVDGYNTGDVSKYSLAELVKDYTVGLQGWHLVGEKEPDQPMTPPAVAGTFVPE